MKTTMFFLVLALGCRPCEDIRFKSKFQNQIRKLEMLKSYGVSAANTTDSIDIASNTLFLITGTKAKISRNYTYLYYHEDFTTDSTKWNRWYEENRCKVTEALFDSIYSIVIESYKK
jgi:hypothetical protein